MLQIYHQSLVDGTFEAVDSQQLLPIILDNSGKSDTIFYFKNISNKILNTIHITSSGISGELNLSWLVTDSTSDEVGSFANGEIDHTISYELYPGDGFKLFTKTNSTSNIGIDYNKISLDITYNYSDISTSDMLVLFEFMEANGVTTIESTVNSVSGSVNSNRVIRGNGIAFFGDGTETVTFTGVFGSNGLTFLLKGLFDISNSSYKIATMGNLEIGINAQRQVYAKVGNTTITTVKTLINYNEEYVIGVSIKTTDDLFITINGVKSALTNVPSSPVSLSVTSSTSVVIGSGLIGELDVVALYNDNKNLAFHNEFYLRIL